MRGARDKGRGTRTALLFACLLSPVLSFAQTPDVRAHLDLALTLDYRDNAEKSARLYDPLGHPSIVSINALLESGYDLVVSERLQRLPHDADGDIFDEAYAEDPGLYRVGKQYLPFGTGRLLHESVLAARIDSDLIAENLPVALAACNQGSGRENGALLRVGRSVGASFAYGEHFGLSGTSLGVVRRPDDAPGRGGGWKQALGFDAARRFGKFAVSGEFGAFNGGPDRDLSVFDVQGTCAIDKDHAAGIGYSHAEGGIHADFLRLFGRIHTARNLDLEPLVRLRNAGLYDAAVTLRLRL